jgi:transglutaminase-like putative cysteine protease
LRFAGEVIAPFGSAGREGQLAALFRNHRGESSWDAWQIAYAEARAATRGAVSPYQAMVALEAWLRTSRAYDEHMGLPQRPDALARWAASGQAGYCQMFAGSLAALARLSGVPARVAEGFGPGERRGGVYHVTDRDAHAWVEAWFPGYGWLPFDATPGRTLPARASSSSSSFDGRAAQAGQAAAGQTSGLPRLQLPLARLRAVLATRGAGAGAGSPWWNARIVFALAALAGLLAALAVGKRALLRLALPHDPARAARQRVRAFAADQGVELAPSLTPRELAAALEHRFGVRADAFARALERAAYGVPGSRDAGLAAETAALLRTLRATLGRTRRLRGAFALSAVRGRAR